MQGGDIGRVGGDLLSSGDIGRRASGGNGGLWIGSEGISIPSTEFDVNDVSSIYLFSAVLKQNTSQFWIHFILSYVKIYFKI